MRRGCGTFRSWCTARCRSEKQASPRKDQVSVRAGKSDGGAVTFSSPYTHLIFARGSLEQPLAACYVYSLSFIAISSAYYYQGKQTCNIMNNNTKMKNRLPYIKLA